MGLGKSDRIIPKVQICDPDQQDYFVSTVFHISNSYSISLPHLNRLVLFTCLLWTSCQACPTSIMCTYLREHYHPHVTLLEIPIERTSLTVAYSRTHSGVVEGIEYTCKHVDYLVKSFCISFFLKQSCKPCQKWYIHGLNNIPTNILRFS